MGIKEAYQDKLDAQLWELDDMIEELKNRADKAPASARLRYYKDIETLRSKYEEAELRLEELMTAGEAAVDELKLGLQKTWAELRRAVESAGSKIQ